MEKLELEIERMMSVSKRVREYDWKEELKVIGEIFHTTLHSLFTDAGQIEDAK